MGTGWHNTAAPMQEQTPLLHVPSGPQSLQLAPQCRASVSV